eukprot:10644807-Lingulodinium_polyedra.AAC.1
MSGSASELAQFGGAAAPKEEACHCTSKAQSFQRVLKRGWGPTFVPCPPRLGLRACVFLVGEVNFGS